MRFALVLALLSGCAGWFRAPEPLSTPPEVIIPQQYEAALDGVIALVDEDRRPYCSGEWIDQNHAITAAHCTDGDETVQVGIRSAYDRGEDAFLETWTMQVVREDVDTDVALLRWAGSTIPPSHTIFPILDREPYLGERITAIGHALGQGYHFAEGRVTEPHRNGFGMTDPFTAHNAFTIPGMSGGPVLNDQGELVCVTSFTVFSWPTLSGCAHVSSIRAILERPRKETP